MKFYFESHPSRAIVGHYACQMPLRYHLRKRIAKAIVSPPIDGIEGEGSGVGSVKCLKTRENRESHRLPSPSMGREFLAAFEYLLFAIYNSKQFVSNKLIINLKPLFIGI